MRQRTERTDGIATKGTNMTDGFIILGTVGIVGLVAVLAIALVYNRPFQFRGDSSRMEIEAKADGTKPR